MTVLQGALEPGAPVSRLHERQSYDPANFPVPTGREEGAARVRRGKSYTGGWSLHCVASSWDRHMPPVWGLRQRRPQAHLAGPGEFMIIPRQWRSMPGAGTGVAERPGAQPASRQQAAYWCARGHAFTIALAAGIEPPATWGCRCGAPARPAGDTDPGSGQTERDRCMALLLRRRTRAELEQLLAERLTDTAQRRDRRVHLAR
jgi:hypothetical protein